jgi:predicted nuclease of predicted toxin-antitoxin system
MKLLFDQNLSHKLCKRLAELYPDSNHVRLLGMSQEIDMVIWVYARLNDFVLVSFDEDIANLAIFRGIPPKVIWLRCGNQSTDEIERIFRLHFAQIEQFVRDPVTAYLELF